MVYNEVKKTIIDSFQSIIFRYVLSAETELLINRHLD